MKKRSYVGMDCGDRNHEICALDEAGRVMSRVQVANTAEAIKTWAGALPAGSVIALEVGTHSGWISRLLEAMSLRVVVAQPRCLRALWGRDRKNDESDAELLARMVRADASLLHPIVHRSEEAQLDLGLLRSRDALVRARTQLVNTARGIAKSLGYRLPASSTPSFARKVREVLPAALQAALEPVLEVLAKLTEQIRQMERRIEEVAQERYPEAQRLREVTGVGALTALGFVLTIGDPTRFRRSREVGPYLGLVPKQDQSGQVDKQLHITKAGDGYMRRLLVGSAQYILGAFGPACGLRTFGLRLAERGGKNAKKRAVVAVARKLAVLLHALWVGKSPYDPTRGVMNASPA